MAYLALSVVSVGVDGLLNVAALTALATGGVHNDVPQAPTFPFVLYDVSEDEENRGFGTGGLPTVHLRVHCYSTYAGLKEAQAINAKAIQLLRDQAVTVTGYTQAGRIFYDETIALPDELVAGIKCHELVSLFRIYVEEA